MNKRSFIALLVGMVILFCGCHRQPDEDLLRVYELTVSAPNQALVALDSINVEKLSEPNRRFYDFLRLKANDKNYVRHTSDTTILALIDYYKNDSRFGAEMLYYGGRVYSDLGDYPTALTYFQKALQATTESSNLNLRANIVSQTGRLLNSIKLHTHAVPYLREALKLDSLLHDTVNLMYDHQLLGTVYLSLNNLDSAAIFFSESKKIAGLFTELEKAETDVYLGRLEVLRNNPSVAVNILRGVSEKVDSSFYNISLLHTTQAYIAAGLIDSAYIYADALIHSPYTSNKHFAYDYILNSDLQYKIPEDSIKSYLNAYKNSVKRYLNTYESESAIYQNSFFNYNLQVQKRIEAESEKRAVWIWVYCVAGLLIIAFAVIFYLKYRNQRNIVALNNIIERVEYLKMALSTEKDNSHALEAKLSELTNPQPLKEKLLENLMILEREGKKGVINPGLLESDVYKDLKTCLAEKRPVSEDNKIWRDLNSEISKHYPNFTRNLHVLLDGSLSNIEYQTIMLFKCGFTSSEIAILTGRGKSAISDRCRKLILKTFGQKIELNTFVNIISLL